MITYRTLKEQHEFEWVTDMEIMVWSMDERAAIAPHTMMVLTHTGGHIMGAFDGDAMIGCTIAFPMFGEKRLWSHVAAIHPDYRRRGIGYQMKHEQRKWAQERGYTCMSWSFDPLMAANAHFNLRLLGAKTNTHHSNFYGVMNDGINAGMPSDRFEMLWLFSEEDAHPQETPDTAPFLLIADEKGHPKAKTQPEENWLFVEIPQDFSAIRKENLSLAIDWKIAVREAIQPAFAQGYWAVDFVRQDGRNWYALYQSSKE